jgi:hypothetical protein
MSEDLHDQIFPRSEAFGRALLRLVNLADQRGVSLHVEDYKVRCKVAGVEITYELQTFGRTVVRRYRKDRIEAQVESYDFDQGIDLFERYMQETDK